MTSLTPNIARPLGLPRLTPVPAARTATAVDHDARPVAPTTRPGSPGELLLLATDVAASIATLPEGSPAAERRADLLIDALAPLVRIPEGSATVQRRGTVSLREVQILLRWLSRKHDLTPEQTARAVERIRAGLAAT